jgi:cytochrome c oxidase cbb3-type subunit 3
MKKFSIFIALTLSCFSTFATEKAVVDGPITFFGLDITITEILVLALLIFITVLLFVTITLFKAFKVMIEEKENPTPYRKYDPYGLISDDEIKSVAKKPSIWNKLLSLKSLEEEKDMIIPHEYDGIQELNNPTPTWFNVLFYGTMIIAAGYIYYYHIGEYGDKQDQEYENEMVKAAADKRAFLAKSSEKYDENSVKIDQALIANGKTVYATNCAPCHGVNGEGTVGPNLTDEFWLHGGGVKDIFKSIKYGVPEKGMVSWEKNLSSKNIAELSNYIISLKGTKPANAKAPQGILFEEVTDLDTANHATK